MNKTFTKKWDESGEKFIEVRFTDERGYYSLTGTAGRIISIEKAKEEAFLYWRDFFDENPKDIGDLVQRFSMKEIMSYGEEGDSDADACARFVLDADGEYHGLDVHLEEDESVWISGCSGCIHDTILEHFPELKPIVEMHLHDTETGLPMHYEANAKHWLKCKDMDVLAKHLQIPLNELHFENFDSFLEERKRFFKERNEFMKRWILNGCSLNSLKE